MDIRDAIKMLEDASKNGNIKIVKVEYYEGTNYYKSEILTGQINIQVKYEKRGEKADDIFTTSGI